MKGDAESLGCPPTKSLNWVVAHVAVFGVLGGPPTKAIETKVLSVKALGAGRIRRFTYIGTCELLISGGESKC